MATIRGCSFPDDLHYHVEDDVWARLESDGTLTVGMTSYGCSLAGQVVAFTPKKVGREVEAGRSVATVESGKWVGPVKSPVSGEIVAVNELLLELPGVINSAPYAGGWLVRLKPTDWEGEKGRLLIGPAVAEAYEARMAAEGFGGCESA